MHEERFDAWTTAFASTLSRRRALGAMLSVALLSHGSRVRADPGTAKRKGHYKGRGRGHDKGQGQGHEFDAQCIQLACEELAVPRTSPPEVCCAGEFCSCGGDCCGPECFQIGDISNPDWVFCCIGDGLVICGEGKDATCCDVPCEQCHDPGQSGLAGSYRRPG